MTLVFGNLASVLRVRALIKSAPGPVYVPYPSIFFLLWLSLIPKKYRPYCIVDSYISIWDAIFRDRIGNSHRSFLANCFKYLEKRALRVASVVLVDTEANRDLFISEFGLDPMRVKSIPLAIDEGRLKRSCQVASKRPDRLQRVLFVGTLIPLHGIDVLLEAFAQLNEDKRFEFRLIGDGQQSQLVSDFLDAYPSAQLTWVRAWNSLDQIAGEIASADICLGIFGGTGKASRVLPFKLYMYFACGKAVISQSFLSTPSGVPFPPIEGLGISPSNLSDAIKNLANNLEKTAILRRAAAEYYCNWLSNSCVISAWRDILTDVKR